MSYDLRINSGSGWNQCSNNSVRFDLWFPPLFFSTNPLVTFPSTAGFWLCLLVQAPILNERPTQKKFEANVD